MQLFAKYFPCKADLATIRKAQTRLINFKTSLNKKSRLSATLVG